MGVANSQNVSDSIAEVTKEVTNKGSNDMEVYDYINQTVNFSNCRFGGDVDVTQVASNITRALQTQRAMQNSDLSTEIQQKLVQAAQSSNGWLSYGFASASNTSGQVASSSSKVSQVISDTATSVTTTTQKFVCDDSVITGKFSLSQYTTDNFYGSQTIDSTQVTKIKDNIDQSVSQTATAQNAGIFSGLAFLIILVIAVVSLKVLSSFGKKHEVQQGQGQGNAAMEGILVDERRGYRKSLNRINTVFAIIALIFTVIMIILYCLNAGPWYSPLYVTRNVSSKRIGCDIKFSVSDGSVQTQVSLEFSPFRYLLPITGKGADASLPSLLSLAIYKASSATLTNSVNGGYNKELCDATSVMSGTKNTWIFDKSATPLPPLLMVPEGNFLIPENFMRSDGVCGRFQCGDMRVCNVDDDYNVCGYTLFKKNNDGIGKLTKAPDKTPSSKIIAIPNEDEWYTHIQNSPEDCRHARFMLSKYLEFPCDFYVNNDDYVAFYDETGTFFEGQVSTNIDKLSKNVYKVIPSSTWNESDGNGITGPVTISGYFSRCMDQHSKAKDNSGTIIGLIALVIIIMFLGFYIPNKIGFDRAGRALRAYRISNNFSDISINSTKITSIAGSAKTTSSSNSPNVTPGAGSTKKTSSSNSPNVTPGAGSAKVTSGASSTKVKPSADSNNKTSSSNRAKATPVSHDIEMSNLSSKRKT